MKNVNPTQDQIDHLLERMTLFQKYILICRLSYLVTKRKLFLSLRAIPDLIITTSGIHFDRRINRPPHFVNERRLVELIRRKILLIFEDREGTS